MDKVQAKQISIVQILGMFGAKAERSSEKDAMYFSPFRKEKTASLHVDHAKNLWYDHGEGAGGDGIALVQRWLTHTREDASFYDALRWMRNMFGGDAFTLLRQVEEVADKPHPVYELLKVGELKHVVLVRYLVGRGLPLDIANLHLKEVHVLNRKSGKRFFAIGFQNDEGGYELRTPTLKSSVSPKGLTFIRGTVAKPPAVHIFEGWPDFLSHLVLEKTDAVPDDAIVLNSLSFLKPALALVEGYGYERLYSWTHNDEAGLKALGLIDSFVRSEPGLRHRPMNRIYAGSKDLNEHLNKQTCAVAGKVQP